MTPFKRLYNNLGLLLLNTLLLFIGLNLLLALVYAVVDYRAANRAVPEGAALFTATGAPVDNGKRMDYQMTWFDYSATQEVSQSHAAEVLDDFYDLSQVGFVYQPWVQFSEPPFAGQRVSVGVDGRGFPVRGTSNPPANPARPAIEVFVLGGSTTFGYNVADEHTWPSRLSVALNAQAQAAGLPYQINVTNYGRGYYDSSQEMVLFIDLLKNGHRPALVIFMDGVNWGPARDVPYFTEAVQQNFAGVQRPSPEMGWSQLKEWLAEWIPLARLARSVKLKLGQAGAPTAEPALVDRELTPEERAQVMQIGRRFAQNHQIIRAVAAGYGVETRFFIQPDPIANYSVELYRTPPPGDWFYLDRRKRLLLQKQLRQANDDAIDLSNLFESYGVGPSKKVIVDDVHYSPNFNRYLAEQVAAAIDVMALSPPDASPETPVDTGWARTTAQP